jgi:hypothetical protein
MDTLKGSCCQNTLKNKTLEHRSYRQERNFIDRKRLSRETHSRVQKLGAPRTLEWGIRMCVCMCVCVCVCVCVSSPLT